MYGENVKEEFFDAVNTLLQVQQILTQVTYQQTEIAFSLPRNIAQLVETDRRVKFLFNDNSCTTEQLLDFEYHKASHF